MEKHNIEWGARGEIEFNIESGLNKKLSVRQAVLYTWAKIVDGKALITCFVTSASSKSSTPDEGPLLETSNLFVSLR